MKSTDMRGGTCGGTNKTGQCGEPLLFGHCRHHGKRIPDAPITAPKPAWMDGRTIAGRRKRAEKEKP